MINCSVDQSRQDWKNILEEFDKNSIEFAQKSLLAFQIYKFDQSRNLIPDGSEDKYQANPAFAFNFYIGSNPQECQRVLEDQKLTISGQHALIRYDNQFGWLLYDGIWEGQNQVKPSSNGTFVQLNDFDSLVKRGKKSLGQKLYDNMIFNLSGYLMEVRMF